MKILVLNYSYRRLDGDEVMALRTRCGFGEDAEFIDVLQYAGTPIPDAVIRLLTADDLVDASGSHVDSLPYILLLNGDAFEALKGLGHARACGLWSDEEWPMVVVRHFGKELIEMDLEEFIQYHIAVSYPVQEEMIDEEAVPVAVS